MSSAKRTCYISGKMRGLPQFGFPNFDRAKEFLIKKGWRTYSPADMDRMIGFDEKSPEGYDFSIEDALRRDFLCILQECTDVVCLPNWRASEGAKAELLVATKIGLPLWEINLDTGWVSPLKVDVDLKVSDA